MKYVSVIGNSVFSSIFIGYLLIMAAALVFSLHGIIYVAGKVLRFIFNA